jgi:hypothetical protein
VRGAPGRPGYDVSVQGVFSAVEVRSDPAIAHEPPPVDSPAEAPAQAPPPDAPAASPQRPPAEAPPPGRVG